jgi:hypothetical protein
MRICLPTMLLSVAAALSWSAAAAEAGRPVVYEVTDRPAAAGQNPFVDEGASGEPSGLIGRMCDTDSCCGPRWTFTAEGLALERTGTRKRPLLLDTRSGADLLDSQTMGFPVAYGMQLSAIYHNVCGRDLEFVYFQVDGFDASGNVPGNSLIEPDMNGPMIMVRDGRARYTSALYNGEVNVRTQYCEWLTLLAGFRMLQLNEQLGAEGLDVQSRLVPAWMQVNANNHLYGLQLGAEGELYNCGGALQVSGLCKAGVFGNAAEQNCRVVDACIGVDERLGATRNQATFLGETGVVLTYALTKRLAFRASAEAMWLNGVALAPEQISTTNLRAERACVNTSGGVFYYGGGMGLEARF